jgi:hypothetical protein
MPAKKLTPNKLLSEFLQSVGAETVQVVIDGEQRTITRAEQAAREIYELATGGIQEKRDRKGNIIEVYVPPNPAAFRLIREYTEGKPSQDIQKEIADRKKSGKLNGGTRRRLGEILNKPKAIPPKKAGRPTTIPEN